MGLERTYVWHCKAAVEIGGKPLCNNNQFPNPTMWSQLHAQTMVSIPQSMTPCQVPIPVAWPSISTVKVNPPPLNSSCNVCSCTSSTPFKPNSISSASYHHCPLHDPKLFLSTEELSQANKTIKPSLGDGRHIDHSLLWPWSLISIWWLMRWKESNSAHKLDSEVTWLVQDILQALGFNIDNLRKSDASRETRQMNTA